ncbi:sugar transporter SWEET1 [Venturia canescens]|uniref:sugar transporter SWEET1 n=1 Tax=Venturia canescens TaxID=32260 RepID=UPI001C9C8992|nr:sugar transporter SWEET1 [Venturia canescens]
MDLMNYKEILASSASICTISQFLAGILVCRKFIINKSTGDASALPFVMCFMSCGLWMRYGQLIDDPHVILVNLLGGVLQISYTLIYLCYTTKRGTIVRQIIGALFFVTMVYAYSIMEFDRKVAASIVGFLSCSLTILFFASPLIMLAHVIRVRSAESLPFPVITATFVSSILWFTYGVLIDDTFIKTPNFLGCVLSGFQLALFVVYPKKKVDQMYLI